MAARTTLVRFSKCCQQAEASPRCEVSQQLHRTELIPTLALSKAPMECYSALAPMVVPTMPASFSELAPTGQDIPTFACWAVSETVQTLQRASFAIQTTR